MTMAMELIRHIAGLYSGKAIKGDFTQIYITGNEIWMAQQILASQQEEGAQGDLDEYAEFESWLEREKPAGCVGDMERGWMARATLAQPSPLYDPKRCLACGGDHGNSGLPCPNMRVTAQAQPSPAPELDFAKPLETASGEPVKWICSDVIEYKSARVCVDQNTGLVYSSPYIGLKIRNVMPAPELERPEVVAWMWRDINGDMQFNYMHPEGEPLMTVAQHDRIVGALQADIGTLMETRNGLVEEIGQLHSELCDVREERDAAQARVAELEKQEPALWFWLERGDENNDFARRARYTAKRPTNLQADLGMTPYYAAPVAQAGQVPEGYMLITQDQVERHATTAWECPPQSRVVLVSTLKRLHEKNVAAPQPAGGADHE